MIFVLVLYYICWVFTDTVIDPLHYLYQLGSQIRIGKTGLVADKNQGQCCNVNELDIFQDRWLSAVYTIVCNIIQLLEVSHFDTNMTNSTISSAKYSGKQPNCLEGEIGPSLE